MKHSLFHAALSAALFLSTISATVAQDAAGSPPPGAMAPGAMPAGGPPPGGPPPGGMPPGMTPAIMKMMMAPGPKHPKGLPKDVEPEMGCIPAMGFHYVNPKNAPFGPIYGYYKGKAIFTEIMVSKALFDAGKSWDNELKPLPGHAIDHVDIWWEPHGHPGYLVPHYDIHAWYVPHAEHMTYCGNASGKKPAFL